MRSFLWLGLALLVFYCLKPVQAVGWGSASAPPSPPRGAKALGVIARLPELVPLWVIDVKGVGASENAARTDSDALEKACQDLAAYLKRHYPDIDWQPTVEDLEQAKMIEVVGEPAKKTSDSGETYYVATLKVALNQQQLLALRETARQHRVQDRHHTAALALVAICVFLVVAVGYLKLEEMTRGFYTGLLRVVAVGILALAGAGIWLLR
jgi:hypothetical protein